ncbi:hypothetical protein ACFZAU_24740 [Streptomyces sp. NPDC008238]
MTAAPANDPEAQASPDRHLHFVGSLPQFRTAEQALRWQVGDLAGRLRRLCGGETGDRLLWFVPVVKALKVSPKVRVVRDGDWSGYDDTDRLAVRRGERLRGADVPLRLAGFAAEELHALAAMGHPATAGLPLQVGIPGYLDMALFTFGPVGMARAVHAFFQALAAEIRTVHAAAGDTVVFQLESPAALVAVNTMPRPLRRPAARLLARLVARQAAAAPRGSRFGVHLCFGDLGHRAASRPHDAAAVAELADALIRRWPKGRTLEYVHLPLAAAQEPPSVDPRYYAPLRRLGARTDTALVAGIAHEAQSREDQRTALRLAEEALGRRVDIATSCGLGRRSPLQAEEAATAMLALSGADGA